MKIRLDFVTNSSSSSYLISIGQDESATIEDVFDVFNASYFTDTKHCDDAKYREMAIRILKEKLESTVMIAPEVFVDDMIEAGFPKDQADSYLEEHLGALIEASIQIYVNPDKLHKIINEQDYCGISLKDGD